MIGGLQNLERDLGIGVDQFGPSRARDRVPAFPHTDVDGRDAKPGRNFGGTLGGDKVGVSDHARHVTNGYAKTQELVTPSYVLRGSLRGMDDRWKSAVEPHERLRWARVQWQEAKGIKPDAGAAADSLGIKQHTYRAYERRPDSSKHTRLDDQRAIQFARKFGVNWQWLLTGEGSPDASSDALTPTERRMIDALREAPEARQAAAADAIIQLLKIA